MGQQYRGELCGLPLQAAEDLQVRGDLHHPGEDGGPASPWPPPATGTSPWTAAAPSGGRAKVCAALSTCSDLQCETVEVVH